MKHLKVLLLSMFIVLFSGVMDSDAQIYMREKIVDDGTEVNSSEATGLGNDLIRQYAKNEPANSQKLYDDDYSWQNYNEENPDAYIKEGDDDFLHDDTIGEDDW